MDLADFYQHIIYSGIIMLLNDKNNDLWEWVKKKTNKTRNELKEKFNAAKQASEANKQTINSYGEAHGEAPILRGEQRCGLKRGKTRLQSID